MRTPDESGDEETAYMQTKMSFMNGTDMGHSDWKTDVAEFVPSGNGFGGQFHSANGCDASGCFVGNGGCPDFNFDNRLTANGTDGITGLWALPAGMTAVVAGGQQQAQWIVQMPLTGTASSMMGSTVDSKEAQQLRCEFEWQSRRQEDARIALQERMDQLEQQKMDLKDRWERERKALTSEIGSYRALLTRYAVPLDEAKECHTELGQLDEPRPQRQEDELLQLQQLQPLQALQQFQSLQAMQTQDSSWEENNQDVETPNAEPDALSLDAKLRRLGGLLSEDNLRKAHLTSMDQKSQATAGEDGLGAKSIASTLQAMFPHATVRTQPNARGDGIDKSDNCVWQKDDKENRENRDHSFQPMSASLSKEAERDGGSMSDAVVRRMAHGLEALTGSEIDDLQWPPYRRSL